MSQPPVILQDSISGLTDDELVVVRSYLEFPFNRIEGFQMRIFARMGDRLAVAIAKVLYPLDRADETLVRKVVAALHIAFESTENIENQLDRKPAIALLLLDALSAHAESVAQKASLRTAREELVRRGRNPACPQPSLEKGQDA
jgi:hypothetical protein